MNVAAHNDFVLNEKRCSTSLVSWMMAASSTNGASLARRRLGDCGSHKYS